MEYLLQLVVKDREADQGGSVEFPMGALADRYFWFAHDGLLVAEETLDRPVTKPHVKQMAAAIRSEGKGRFTAERWFDDLVTRGDIAARVGVSVEAVRLWSRGERGPGMPEPLGHVGGGERRSPVWRWGAISEWLDAQGKSGGDAVGYPSDVMIAVINCVLVEEASFESRSMAVAVGAAEWVGEAKRSPSFTFRSERAGKLAGKFVRR